MPSSRIPLRYATARVPDAAHRNRVGRLLFYTALPNSDSGEAINKALGRQFSDRFIDGLDMKKTPRRSEVPQFCVISA
jgi:hypothetical protein